MAQRSVSRLAPNPAPANSFRTQATPSKPSPGPRCGRGSIYATLNGSRHSRPYSYDHHRLGLSRPALAPQSLARCLEIRSPQARPRLPLLDEPLDRPRTVPLADAQQCSCGRYRPTFEPIARSVVAVLLSGPMPLQNRVTPFCEIISTPSRDLFMGNRGILHDVPGRLGQKRWRHKNWIICQLEFKGRRIPLMNPGRYTALFFLDEAVALAAGHRACYECRRDRYHRFTECWQGDCPPKAREMDRILHKQRVDSASRRRISHVSMYEKLPSGTFVARDEDAWLVLDSCLARYTPEGYDRFITRPRGEATVLTPPASIHAIAVGYSVGLHPSAYEC